MSENLELEQGLDQGKKRARRKKGEGLRYDKAFRFTDRDKKALKWIAEQGTATVEQVWCAVWKDAESKSSKYSDERLRAMAKGGYIKRERVFGSGTTNYLITQKGRYLVEETFPDRKEFFPPVPRRIDSGQYGHTMALNWCRIYLEKDPNVANWMSDRAVQSWLKRREYKGSLGDWMRDIDKVSPDACFEYRGERWLFEYEATQKNKTKYEEKAETLPWWGDETIQGVIFVAATGNLKAILEKHFESKYRAFVIFTLDELKQGVVLSYLQSDKPKKPNYSKMSFQELIERW